uniref:Annexin 11 n=1 Tax=Spironucleus vortens TaxID=58336 RepID=A0A142C679_SPIVO|nr:annexin 11 [Spironucleus vortens]
MSCCASDEIISNEQVVCTFNDAYSSISDSKINSAVKTIGKACKGLGTNEKKLIKVTSVSNNIERDAISLLYTQKYNKTLHDLFKSELSGNLEKLFIGMYNNRYVFWAEQIKEAVKGAGTDEKKLIDLLVSTGSEYAEVDRVFTQLYKKCIYETLSSECGTSCWGKLMKAWITNQKTAGNAQSIAESLHKATKGFGTDEKKIINLLTTTDQATYKQVDEQYKQLYGKLLRDVLISEFSGKAEYAFLAVHDYLLEPARFVANMLHLAVKGLGTNDDKIVYTTVLHCNTFAPCIKAVYKVMGFGNVKNALKGDLSGKYEKAVLAFWSL